MAFYRNKKQISRLIIKIEQLGMKKPYYNLKIKMKTMTKIQVKKMKKLSMLNDMAKNQK